MVGDQVLDTLLEATRELLIISINREEDCGGCIIQNKPRMCNYCRLYAQLQKLDAMIYKRKGEHGTADG